MNKIEERLAKAKQGIDSVTAPEQLEIRLRDALDTVTPKKTTRKAPFWRIAAVILLCIIIVGNQYNVFAYYGKKLFGFDEVLYGTLKQLNDEGLGQIIEKQIELGQGTQLIINGIMNDANQFIMYYTLTNPNSLYLEHNYEIFRPLNITGFLTNSRATSGTSVINEEQTEIKGAISFDSVSPFAKKLTLHFWKEQQNGQLIEQKVTFPFNPNKALQTKLVQSIKKSVQVDKGRIKFNKITATPISTVIDGTLHVENFDRVYLGLDGIELWANGVLVENLGSGSRSSFRGRSFDLNYDALPEQLDSLELIIKEFVGYQKLDQKISLSNIDEEPILLDDKEMWIKKVATTSEGVEITFATDEDVLLDGVSIETNHEITPLRTTVNQFYTKLEDGRVLKERTILFDSTITPEYIIIDGMHYMKTYNYVIEIPVN